MFSDRVDLRLTERQIIQLAKEDGVDPDELFAEVKRLEQKLG